MSNEGNALVSARKAIGLWTQLFGLSVHGLHTTSLVHLRSTVDFRQPHFIHPIWGHKTSTGLPFLEIERKLRLLVFVQAVDPVRSPAPAACLLYREILFHSSAVVPSRHFLQLQKSLLLQIACLLYCETIRDLWNAIVCSSALISCKMTDNSR